MQNNDFLHRVLYCAHIFTVFVTAMFTANKEQHEFSVALSGEALSWSSCGARVVLALLFAWAAVQHEEKAHHKQLLLHAGILTISSLIFASAVWVHADECGETEEYVEVRHYTDSRHLLH